jgi:hypothetical protein
MNEFSPAMASPAVMNGNTVLMLKRIRSLLEQDNDSGDAVAEELETVTNQFRHGKAAEVYYTVLWAVPGMLDFLMNETLVTPSSYDPGSVPMELQAEMDAWAAMSPKAQDEAGYESFLSEAARGEIGKGHAHLSAFYFAHFVFDILLKTAIDHVPRSENPHQLPGKENEGRGSTREEACPRMAALVHAAAGRALALWCDKDARRCCGPALCAAPTLCTTLMFKCIETNKKRASGGGRFQEMCHGCLNFGIDMLAVLQACIPELPVGGEIQWNGSKPRETFWTARNLIGGEGSWYGIGGKLYMCLRFAFSEKRMEDLPCGYIEGDLVGEKEAPAALHARFFSVEKAAQTALELYMALITEAGANKETSATFLEAVCPPGFERLAIWEAAAANPFVPDIRPPFDIRVAEGKAFFRWLILMTMHASLMPLYATTNATLEKLNALPAFFVDTPGGVMKSVVTAAMAATKGLGNPTDANQAVATPHPLAIMQPRWDALPESFQQLPSCALELIALMATPTDSGLASGSSIEGLFNKWICTPRGPCMRWKVGAGLDTPLAFG